MEKRPDANKFRRQLGIVDIDRLADLKVAIVGAGAVGSFTALLLAKMGVGSIKVWDGDTVELYNIPNQFHSEKSIGKNKTESLKELLIDMAGVEIESEPYVIIKESPISFDADIVILAVDSIEARKMIWEQFIKNKFGIKLLLDPRMGGESYRAYALRPTDTLAQSKYEATLYEKEDETPCSERSIIYNVAILSGMLARLVKGFVSGEALKFEVLGDLNNFLFYYNDMSEENE